MPIYVFGSNMFGQLGLDESIAETDTPIALPYNASQVSAGYMHSLAIVDEKVLSWGVNDDHAVGKDDEMPSFLDLPPIKCVAAGGSASCAVAKNGDLFLWGTFRDDHGIFGATQSEKILEKPTKILSGVKSVICAKNYIVIADNNGSTVSSFGVGTRNELGYFGRLRFKKTLVPRTVLGDKKNILFSEIFAGLCYGGAINSNNDYFNWRDGYAKKIMKNVKYASIGHSHEHVVTVEGRVLGRGSNSCNQIGADKTGEWTDIGLENVDKVKTKIDCSVAQIGNELWSWGPSTFGETGFFGRRKTPEKIDFRFGEILDFSVGGDFTIVAAKQ